MRHATCGGVRELQEQRWSAMCKACHKCLGCCRWAGQGKGGVRCVNCRRRPVICGAPFGVYTGSVAVRRGACVWVRSDVL